MRMELATSILEGEPGSRGQRKITVWALWTRPHHDNAGNGGRGGRASRTHVRAGAAPQRAHVLRSQRTIHNNVGTLPQTRSMGQSNRQALPSNPSHTCEKSCELPKTRTAANRQSAYLCRVSGGLLLVPQEGFEPPTPSLRMMCHTGERLTLRIHSPYVSRSPWPCDRPWRHDRKGPSDAGRPPAVQISVGRRWCRNGRLLGADG
jgi:hypothetical protein